jgi:alpha-ribazole phosphatase
VCYGRSDLPLECDPAGDVAAVASLLPAGAPLYSSPLERCQRFAAALCAAPHIDARLTEIDFGVWELRRWDAIDRAALDAWADDPLGYAGHGGESVATLQARVADLLAELRRDHTTAVLVTHAGVIKAAVAQLLELPSQEWLALSFAYASVTRIDAPAGRVAGMTRLQP